MVPPQLAPRFHPVEDALRLGEIEPGIQADWMGTAEGEPIRLHILSSPYRENGVLKVRVEGIDEPVLDCELLGLVPFVDRVGTPIDVWSHSYLVAAA